MLKLQKREETRVHLNDDGAIIILDPITPKMRRRVFRMYREALEKEGVDLTKLAEGDSVAADLSRDLGDLISGELIRMGAREWAGIGDADDNPLELTPDQETRIKTATDPKRPTGTIDLLLEDESAFEKINAEYVMADIARRAEKNALSGSPTGTSAAATPGTTIAGSPAKPKRARGARNARTESTNSKRKRARGSGKS
jgi:hypothetical protein